MFSRFEHLMIKISRPLTQSHDIWKSDILEILVGNREMVKENIYVHLGEC